MKIFALLGYFVEYPRKSTRQDSEICHVMSSIDPYTFSIVQHLKKLNFPRRVEFSEFILLWSQEKKIFLIIFEQMKHNLRKIVCLIDTTPSVGATKMGWKSGLG